MPAVSTRIFLSDCHVLCLNPELFTTLYNDHAFQGKFVLFLVIDNNLEIIRFFSSYIWKSWIVFLITHLSKSFTNTTL